MISPSGENNASYLFSFNTTGNLTGLAEPGQANASIPSYIRTCSMVACIVILGLGVVGNVMVPLVILRTKDMRNSTNIFLMNLSLADLLVLLVCTPSILVEVNSKPETWVLGEQMCKDYFKMEYTSFGAEDGQYLANTVGEPLVKGLTELARIKPRDPITFLANFLINFVNSSKQKNNKEASAEALDDGLGPKGDVELIEDSEKAESLEGFEDEDNLTDDVGNVDEDELNDLNERQDSPSIEENAFKPIQRDEHGQSMIHYAAARSHGRNGLLQLLQEVEGNVGLRDGLYRSARDIADQVDLPENAESIDKYVVALAARGENDKLEELIWEGYDHILDTKDGDQTIIDVVQSRDNQETLNLLKGIPSFEEKRERLHRAIRFGSARQVSELMRAAKGLPWARNQQGRTSLHIAVLCQHEPIVQLIANKFNKTLHIGDNLLRTPLHYAMGVDKVEALSSILINAGSQRVVKDLRGRQPSYYFMNKTEIQKLQDEEEALTV